MELLIISLIIIGLLSLISICFLFYTYKLRSWNPIQELSPLLTIFQGLSLYIFVVITLLVIVYDRQNSFTTTKILMIFQNFFRGLFIYITVFKSLRVTLAFHLNIKSSFYLKFLCDKLFRYQLRILMVALFMTSAFWSGIYYIVKLYHSDISYEDQDSISDLIQYEEINIVEAINNTLEISLCISIIYWNQKIYIPQFDTIQRYINKPLVIYAIWLYINTFISYFIEEKDSQSMLPISLIIMLLSQILRCIVEFYFIVILPVFQSTLIRLPLIPSIILDNFQLFMRIPLCSNIFYDFLQQQSQNTIDSTKDRRINSSASYEYLDSLQVLRTWMIYQMKQENGIEDEHFTLFMNLEKQQNETQFDLNHQPQIQVRLEKHLGQLFEEYKNTYSYYSMGKLFHRLDNATRNFYQMNIIQNFLN
ncbi:unnamed protein product [Paramecium sonneborni]|uniref:Uncharacterized protein n=1 Tax=Paramecium sonneborni TaxID=65129 RepID=A0A8S1QZ37_9CILI|nr:unnamed protein product [Paramecium sonneborni]